MKTRTCIVATKNVPIILLPQYCDGDITSVLYTSMDGEKDELVMSSAYMPSDARNKRPGDMVCELVNFSSKTCRPLVLACDTNSHHTLWGSSNINSYCEELMEFIASTSLEILNKGKEPTFVTKTRKEVLDVTFATRSILDRIANWRVSNEETLSDHKEINFEIQTGNVKAIPFKNPRRTDWECFKARLNELLEDMAWNADITTCEQHDTQVTKLTSVLREAFMSSCPNSSVKQRGIAWWNKKLNTLKLSCIKLYRWHSRGPDEGKEVRWAAYTERRNEYTSKIAKSKKNA